MIKRPIPGQRIAGAGGAGDYGSLRGGPAFPRLPGDEVEPVER